MTSGSRSSQKPSPVVVICATLWAIGFLIFFFQQKLPNTSVSRQEIRDVVQTDWPTVLNPLDYSVAGHPDAGWQNFGERLPFIATAALLLAVSWGLGNLVCRPFLYQLRLLSSERLVIVQGVGLSLQTLWILVCGLAGHLTAMWILAPGTIALMASACSRIRRRQQQRDTLETLPLPPPEKAAAGLKLLFVLAMIPFGLHIVLGGMTPPFDFDVREYHMQGPKEWFLTGHIHTLEHNVYTSFPFLSEMLSLAAMTLHDDWWMGAISGKLTLAAFQFLSAVAVLAIGRRWIGQPTGLIAAMAFFFHSLDRPDFDHRIRRRSDHVLPYRNRHGCTSCSSRGTLPGSIKTDRRHRFSRGKRDVVQISRRPVGRAAGRHVPVRSGRGETQI